MPVRYTKRATKGRRAPAKRKAPMTRRKTYVRQRPKKYTKKRTGRTGGFYPKSLKNSNASHGSTSSMKVVDYPGRLMYLAKKDIATYVSSFKHIGSSYTEQLSTSSYQIANIGDDTLGRCRWEVVRPFGPNAIDLALAEAAGTTTSDNIDPNRNVFIESASRVTRFNNANYCRVQMDIWRCYPRKDVPSGAERTVVNTGDTPPTLLSNGFENVSQGQSGGPSTSLVSTTAYDATPYMSPSWCSAFKMKHIKSQQLEPGQAFTLTTDVKIGRVFNKQRYYAETTDTIADLWSHTKDCGCVYLVRFRGTPVHWEPNVNLTLPIITGTLPVSTGGWSIDVVNTLKVKLRVPISDSYLARGRISNSLTGYVSTTGYVTTGFANWSQFNQDGAGENRASY